MNITPEQASELLDGETPASGGRTGMGALTDTDGKVLVNGPDGNMDDSDADLASVAPDMAETIAGMTWEYAVEHEHSPGNWHQVTQWGPEENPYQPGYGPGDDERIVRRLVGPVEEVTE